MTLSGCVNCRATLTDWLTDWRQGARNVGRLVRPPPARRRRPSSRPRRRLIRNNSARPRCRKIVFPRCGRRMCMSARTRRRHDARTDGLTDVPTLTEHAHCSASPFRGVDVRRVKTGRSRLMHLWGLSTRGRTLTTSHALQPWLGRLHCYYATTHRIMH